MDLGYQREDELVLSNDSSNRISEMGTSALSTFIKTAKPPVGLVKRGRPRESLLTVLG